MIVDRAARLAFAAFLERLANGAPEPADWFNNAVNHYRDEALERIRRDTVRLSLSYSGTDVFGREEAAQLRRWASELRGTAG